MREYCSININAQQLITKSEVILINHLNQSTAITIFNEVVNLFDYQVAYVKMSVLKNKKVLPGDISKQRSNGHR